MWNYMINNPEVFVNSAEEGVAKVKKGGFAYILESTTNDYLRSKDCELIQIGGLLDHKGLYLYANFQIKIIVNILILNQKAMVLVLLRDHLGLT